MVYNSLRLKTLVYKRILSIRARIFYTKVRWNKDGLPELDNKSGIPEMSVPAPIGVKNNNSSEMKTVFTDQFDSDKLKMQFQVLREP